MRKIREQRRNLRFPNNDPVTMIVGNRFIYRGTAKDISQDGAFIVTNGPFRIGQSLVVDFRSIQLKYEKKICNIIRVVQDGVGIQCGNPFKNKLSII